LTKNIKKAHQDWMKNKPSTYKNGQQLFWHLWSSCFFHILSINKQNIHTLQNHPKFASN